MLQILQHATELHAFKLLKAMPIISVPPVCKFVLNSGTAKSAIQFFLFSVIKEYTCT